MYTTYPHLILRPNEWKKKKKLIIYTFIHSQPLIFQTESHKKINRSNSNSGQFTLNVSSGTFHNVHHVTANGSLCRNVRSLHCIFSMYLSHSLVQIECCQRHYFAEAYTIQSNHFAQVFSYFISLCSSKLQL